ncbi:hypothetical protein KR222_003826, partial [Zaprionus bogoriensis]
WAIVALLLVATVSLLPETKALPRRLYGRHLILPHHRHHVHMRAAEPEFVVVEEIKPEECHVSLPPLTLSRQKLIEAISVINITRQPIKELLMGWLKETNESESMEATATKYVLHYLNLTHDANKNLTVDKDKGNPDVELRNILASMAVINHLSNQVSNNETLPYPQYSNYFAYINEKISHNLSQVLNILNIPDKCVGVPTYKYNGHHSLINFAVVMEALKLLDIMEAKYNYMLSSIED